MKTRRPASARSTSSRGDRTGRAAGARLAALASLLATVACAACSACGKSTPGGGPNGALGGPSASASSVIDPPVSRASVPPDAGPAVARDVAMWAVAKDGAAEDLASLAAHEGAAGLIEAAADPALRPTALRALAFARGWSQMPFLAQLAAAKDDEEARIALGGAIALAARPRRSEDVEDATELFEGCEQLAAITRDVARGPERRTLALRAVRMMPCPKLALPTDLDAR